MRDKNENPLAVVTGASSGIGYELAVQFAQNGFDLLVTAEDEGIDQAAEDLESLGTRVDSFQCDLSTFRGVEQLHRRILAMRRPVDVIAINAGEGVGGKFIDTNLEEELNMIDLNVISTVHLAKLVIQDMVDQRQAGRILFTSSIAATMPGPYQAVYAATKAFIQSFALALHHELKEFKITVTALQPGATETNFFHRAHMEDTKVGVQKKDDPADVAKQGFDALMAGKEAVIAGSFKTRMGNVANDLIPEKTKAKMHASISKPGSATNVKKEDKSEESQKDAEKEKA